MGRTRAFVILLAVATATAAVLIVRHMRGATAGRRVSGGILIGDTGIYDAMSHRLLLGSYFQRIAEDIAEVAPARARVLEVGCGPGRLSILLARGHDLDVTGLDLDPEMIRRARANAERAADNDRGGPAFLVGDVASLPFPDRSLDLVVSTLSSHHWSDPTAGLDEIGRVLRPDGRALIWDLRPGVVPFHRDMPDPILQAHASSLRVVSETPWLWPWRLYLSQRIELVPSAESPTYPRRAAAHPAG
jgi:SAM-dependent methyltransferase